jgi:hypothetical protein
MTSARAWIGRLACLAGLVVAIAIGGATPAFGVSPWWHLTSGSRPGHLAQTGVVKNEQQEVIVRATEGDFFLYRQHPVNGREKLEEEIDAPLKYNATPEEVQTVLEGLYGAGNVTVEEGTGDTAELHTWKIEFLGELSDQPLDRVETGTYEAFFCSIIKLCPLAGATSEPPIEARELVPGEYRDGPVMVVTAANLGDGPVDGEGGHPVTIADRLPHGIKPLFIEAFAGSSYNTDGPVQCSVQTVTCTFAGRMSTYDHIELRIAVAVEEGAGGAVTGEENQVSVAGGQAPAASISRPIVVSREPTPYGVEAYEVTPEEEGGAPDTQAGSHPFQVTGTLTLNQVPGVNTHEAQPVTLPRDISSQLPPGLIGNPTPIAQCQVPQFFAGNCPQSSVIGVALVTADSQNLLRGGIETLMVPIDNLAPEPGEPARFGFLATKAAPVFLDASVRTGGDYGVTLTSSTITQTAALLSVKLTFWGVPGDARHDDARGFGCLENTRKPGVAVCNNADEEQPPPFLAMPTSCAAAPPSSGETDSWADPAPIGQRLAFQGEPMARMDGCNRLQFSPSIRVAADGSAASSPTGLNVDVHVPQDGVLAAQADAQAAVRDITVTLPEGLAINPSGGDGLQACLESLVGFTGFAEYEPGSQTATFTSALRAPLQPGLNSCSDASKVGTVRIKTPLLPNALEGAVYLATQNENPFGSLIAMYVVAQDPVSGTLVKLPGDVHLTSSGQLVTTFENSPQLPFEDAELHFFGGERAPLATPAHCGPYTTNASFVPWSSNEPASSTSTFNITSGPHGGPCPGASLPFSPSLTGGTTNINAGAFSPLSTTIGREDGNQDLQSVQLHMPAGLSGLLSNVKLCPEAQANEGTCGPESLIGETTVSAGVGSDPVSVTGGKVYITEHYAGAPFGLSIVNPVKAGPFDLEHDTSSPNNQPPCDCVVVRAKIDVDPSTAALTITTDSSGPHAIPHLIDGIPVQIKKVNVVVNREHFTFNPTNCSPQGISATITSDEGASAPLSVPFQATNCAILKFTPKFSVSTASKTSKAGGASLSVKLAEPPGSMGTQANITKVKVELPKQLPSRLTTLQKACTNAQFESNPAGCPPASFIGHAVVHTPLLPVPLTGPAIFVSHGGEAFPSLVIVLQGYGVTVDLVGTTFISKAGITSTTFKTVPDVPFSSFELTLPQGKFSALAANLPAKANGSFCGQKLVMPVEFIAQNGAVLHQSTPVSVSGCAKKKALTRKQKLAKALKACKRKPKGGRAACSRAAHRRYGVVAKRKKR